MTGSIPNMLLWLWKRMPPLIVTSAHKEYTRCGMKKDGAICWRMNYTFRNGVREGTVYTRSDAIDWMTSTSYINICTRVELYIIRVKIVSFLKLIIFLMYTCNPWRHVSLSRVTFMWNFKRTSNTGCTVCVKYEHSQKTSSIVTLMSYLGDTICIWNRVT